MTSSSKKSILRSGNFLGYEEYLKCIYVVNRSGTSRKNGEVQRRKYFVFLFRE